MSKYKQLLQELKYIDNTADNDIVQNLLRVPKKDKSYESSTTKVPTEHYIHQVDLLFLPEDTTEIPGSKARIVQEFKKVNKLRKDEKLTPFKKDCGYKYLLVAVDLATGACDSEPIKYKYPFIVRDALKRIYSRKILKLPHEIEVDAGNEFKSEFFDYFNDVSSVRRKKAGRHRAQAVVEGVNSLLSKIIQTRMISEEIVNQENSYEWIEEIPSIMEVVNKYFYHVPYEPTEDNFNPIKVKEKTLASDVLPEGTPVRIQLDNPVDAVKTKRLHGNFRIGDIRWENVIRKITRIYLRPDFPPMYEVDNDGNVAYTRNQLQVVLSNEKQPTTKKHKREIILKILKRIKKGKLISFKVLWKSGNTTIEPRSNLMEDVPGLIEEFEDIEKHKPQIINQFKKKNKIYYEVKYGNGKIVNEPKKEFNKRFPTIIEEFELANT
jgi:hypothetical protein